MNEAFLKLMVVLVGGVVSLLLLSLLLFRRVDRLMPIFVGSIGFNIVEALAGTLALLSAKQAYIAVYLSVCVVDLFFSMSVLAEIGRNVLRSNHRPTDGWIRWPGLLFCGGSLLLWPLVPWSNLPHMAFLYWVDLHFTRANTICTIAAVLALLAWSNALKLRWPERELRVMIGMSLQGVVAFAVLVFYADGKVGHQYYWLDLMTPISCICVYLYWLHYFWLDPLAAAKIEPLPAATPARRSCRPDIPSAPDSLVAPNFAPNGFWHPK